MQRTRIERKIVGKIVQMYSVYTCTYMQCTCREGRNIINFSGAGSTIFKFFTSIFERLRKCP